MPTYDYICENCDYRFEQFQAITAKPIRKCPKCGKPIAQDGLKFCPACGAPLMATCQKCGSAFPVGTKFCTNCGGTLA